MSRIQVNTYKHALHTSYTYIYIYILVNMYVELYYIYWTPIKRVKY